MALSSVTYVGNGVLTDFVVTFPYISVVDIKVTVDGAPQTAGVDYNLQVTPTVEVQFVVAPLNLTSVKLQRETDINAMATTFVDGAFLPSADLNRSALQLFYLLQEDAEGAGGGGVTDHGALTGLTDDDHPQYTNPADASQVEAEAGTETATRLFSPLRIAQAITALGGGVTDHGALTGLADDDHPQYLLHAAALLTAALDAGGFNITNVGTVDGRDVSVDGAKLDTVEPSATADLTGVEIKALYEVLTNAFTDALFTKLSGIATGAEVNPDLISQLEAETGTIGTERLFSAERVKQAIAALETPPVLHSGDVAGTTVLAIGALKVLTGMLANGAVTLAKIQDIAQDTILGNDAVLGVPKALTPAEARSIIQPGETYYLQTSAYIQNDSNALGKAALQVTVPFPSTVVSCKFRSDKGNFSSSTASNYWTIDVLHVPAAGGVLSSATGLVVTPLQTDNAIFTGDIPNQLFDVGALDGAETSRIAGDMLTLSMVRSGSGVSQSSNGMGFIVELTRD